MKHKIKYLAVLSMSLLIACGSSQKENRQDDGFAVVTEADKANLNVFIDENSDEVFSLPDAAIWSKLIGYWCNSPIDDEDYYHLAFNEQGSMLEAIVFSDSNKPYYCYLVSELIDNQHLRFYLNEFSGILPASEARELSDYKMDLQPVIECTLQDERSLLLNILDDPKGVMPSAKAVKLNYAENYLEGGCDPTPIPYSYLYSEDDQVEFIKYSRQYIEYLIGKSEPENVSELFLLMPDLFFIGDYDKRKQILSEKRIEQKEPKETVLLEELDLNKNRLKISQTYEFEKYRRDYSLNFSAKKNDESWQIKIISTEDKTSIYDIFYKNGTFIIENRIEIDETQD